MPACGPRSFYTGCRTCVSGGPCGLGLVYPTFGLVYPTLGFLGADVELADSDVSSDKIRMREKYLAQRKAVSVLQGPSRLRARADDGVPTCVLLTLPRPRGDHRTSRTTGAKWYLPCPKRAFAQLSANHR